MVIFDVAEEVSQPSQKLTTLNVKRKIKRQATKVIKRYKTLIDKADDIYKDYRYKVLLIL